MLIYLKVILIILFIFVLIYLLAIMPKLKRNPTSRLLDGWLYAHRGLHDNNSQAPENSMKAFMLAVEHGFGIELDVQLTKDLIPVVHHDYHLRRSCGVKHKISELDYEELKEYTLFKSKERIPAFREVLDTIAGKVPLIIELKIPRQADQLCEAVSGLLKSYPGIYCIESFNPFGLIWYRKHHPEVVRGQLSTDFLKDKINGDKLQFFILKHLLMNFLTKPDFIAYHHKYTKDISFTLCRKLYRVKTAAWTVQSQKEYDYCRKYYKLYIFDSFLPEKDNP